jgi:hypothetical protein
VEKLIKILRFLKSRVAKVFQNLERWKFLQILPFRKRKIWVVRTLNYYASDWSHSKKDKNKQSIMERLYRDLDGSDNTMNRTQGSVPTGIGIISPLNADIAITVKKNLTFSPLDLY